MGLSGVAAEPQRAFDAAQILRIGCYGSFNTTNAVVVDTDYGIAVKFLPILDYYYLVDTSVDVDLALPFDMVSGVPRIVPGFGLNTQLRLNLIPIPKMRSTIFVEGVLGLIIYGVPYPDNGTNINGERHLGFGIEYHIDKATTFLVAVRWFHTSNGDIYGAARNPAVNTIGVNFGFSSSLL